MKYKLFISGLIFVFSVGCNTYTTEYYDINKELWIFANDIVENPENLRVLKEKYPNILDDRYFVDSLYSRVYLDSLIQYIKIDFKKRTGKKVVPHAGFTNLDVKNFNTILKYFKLFSKDELYGFGIEKRGKGVLFVFIKVKERYYLSNVQKYTMYSGNDPMYSD